jgi:hypothetical protein
LGNVASGVAIGAGIGVAFGAGMHGIFNEDKKGKKE